MHTHLPKLLPLALCLAACTSGELGSGTPGPGAAPSVLADWTFDGDGIPAGFELASGRWRPGTDRSAPSGQGVLLQEAKSDPAAFNVALAGALARDLELEVALRPIEGDEDRGGGLVWRAYDGSNYYVARWNPLEDNFRLYKVVEGQRTMLASADAHLDGAAWHKLRVRMVGDRIECALDGQVLLEARDATFSDEGRVGLWTKADARTAFDDLVLREPPAGG
jgi:hypothetical protein